MQWRRPQQETRCVGLFLGSFVVSSRVHGVFWGKVVELKQLPMGSGLGWKLSGGSRGARCMKTRRRVGEWRRAQGGDGVAWDGMIV